jgi:hypothetical protein
MNPQGPLRRIDSLHQCRKPKIHSSRMIGIGMPISHSKMPLPTGVRLSVTSGDDFG